MDRTIENVDEETAIPSIDGLTALYRYCYELQYPENFIHHHIN
ncbi:MAG: hypothetical protein ACYCYM_04450 [Saccharofermentanales bacterium]